MKVPEKIYVANNVFPTHVVWDGSPINTKRIDDSDIEYIRTDAFIEKAWSWIEDNILSSNQQDKSSSYCKQFRNYMKGE